MGFKYWSEEVIVVDLPKISPKEPEKITRELRTTIEEARNKKNFDVIVDFSNVDFLASENITALAKLRILMNNLGRRLILCNVASVTKDILEITGLNEFFEFADNEIVALGKIDAE